MADYKHVVNTCICNIYFTYLGPFSAISAARNLSVTPPVSLSENVSQICKPGPFDGVILNHIYNDFICMFTNQHVSEHKLSEHVSFLCLQPTYLASQRTTGTGCSTHHHRLICTYSHVSFLSYTQQGRQSCNSGCTKKVRKTSIH